MKHLLISVYCVRQNNYGMLLEILEAVKDEHIGVELAMHSRYCAEKPGFLPELARWKDALAPYYRTFHGPFREVEASSPPGSAAHNMLLEAYREAFDFYHDFGGNSIVMHTNQRLSPDGDPAVLRSNCAAAICELAELAREKGARLCVENVGVPWENNVLFDEDEYIRLFQHLPETVGSLIDTGHAFLQRWDMERLIRNLAGRITSYHINNNDGVHDSHRSVFEENCFYSREDWRRLFTLMETYTPDAEWILEYAPGPHISIERMEYEIREVLRLYRDLKN